MNELTLEPVRFNTKYEGPGKIYIDFDANGFPFYLCFAKKEKGAKWEVLPIMHDMFTEDRICPFCNNEDDDVCFKFPLKKEPLTKILLKQKEIRLKAMMKGIREEGILY